MTTVSIIVPVHNEANTVGKVLDELLEFQLPGVVTQIIVVHSWSTDGTALVLERYRGRVILVTETYPKGKGHAVRNGLKRATGDIVMIQDADLEYSIKDYPKLLQPVIDKWADFVLGSRHYNGQQLRQFDTSPFKAWLMNVGHHFFTHAINRLFGGSMKDPFTMFKVFRRSCIEGAEFQCNRFDFDFELVITLLQRGCRPMEVPVSYRSRCFHQGKKVRMLMDPPTWIWVMIRMWMKGRRKP